LGVGRRLAAESVTGKLRHDHSWHHLYDATAESITTAIPVYADFTAHTLRILNANSFGLSQSLSGNPLVDETPQVVIMPGQAHLARLVRRTKSFFVEEHGLFPKSAAWSNRVDGKCVRAENLRERFGEIRLDLWGLRAEKSSGNGSWSIATK
jgi:hypothetical protein